jgi:hypothetical protein
MSQSPSEADFPDDEFEEHAAPPLPPSRSCDRFHSVFNPTEHAAAGGGKSSAFLGAASRTADHTHTSAAAAAADARTVNPWTLKFHHEQHEIWFVTRFYYFNRNTALVGALLLVLISLAATIVGLPSTSRTSLSSQLSRYFALALSSIGALTALGNAILQRLFLPVTTTSATSLSDCAAEVIRKDAIWYAFFSWWEVSLTMTHLSTILLSYMYVAGKSAGCMWADSTQSPVENQFCVVNVVFDGVLLLPIIAQGIALPIRWMLFFPMTITVLLVFFVIRVIPGVSAYNDKFMATISFIFSVPVFVLLAVRYFSERDLRRLFLTELQLEEALKQLSVLTARHESLLVPWVPLPVEEQVKLLHSTRDYLWGLSTRTTVGAVQLANFSSWIARSGACEGARALKVLVTVADEYYDLFTQFTKSLLKCHVDGDRYLLVCPNDADAGLLFLTVASTLRDFEVNLLSKDCGLPLLSAAVACGVAGVAGIGASGTLIPVGPAVNQLIVLLAKSATLEEQMVVVSSDVYELIVNYNPCDGHQSMDDDVPALAKKLPTAQVVASLQSSVTDVMVTRGALCFVKSEKDRSRLVRDAPLCVNTEFRMWIIQSSSLEPEELQRHNTTRNPEEPKKSWDDSALSSSTRLVAQTPLSKGALEVTACPFNRDCLHYGSMVTTPCSTDPCAVSRRSFHVPPPTVVAAAVKQDCNSTLFFLRHSNLQVRRFFVLYRTFTDASVERRFYQYVADTLPYAQLLAVSSASLTLAVFLFVLGFMHDQTSVSVGTPMSFAIAALAFGALLVFVTVAHHLFGLYRAIVFAAHEPLFICFYAFVLGAIFSAEPGSSPLGNTQFAWLYVLTTLNFVRPRAHGPFPHVALDVAGSALFMLQALLYPYRNESVRYYNIIGIAVIALFPAILYSLLDAVDRKRFVVDVRLEELHGNAKLLHEDINKLLVSTRIKNPAFIFAARAQRNRLRLQRSRQRSVESPLEVDGVDPSMSTATASRVIDSGVLLIEFSPSIRDDQTVLTSEQLTVFVSRAKRLIATVDAVLASGDYNGSLRIVKATPTTLLILSDSAVAGRSPQAASGKGGTDDDVLLLQLALHVVHEICPDHQMVGRAVADSGQIVGVLLGTSSISFEFTGPVVSRARCLLEAAPWDACFVTKRLIRYSGRATDARTLIQTSAGTHGEVQGTWDEWRVRGLPKVLIAPVVRFCLMAVLPPPTLLVC